MGTFICSSQCEILCSSKQDKKFVKYLFKQIVYYRGLTEDEKKLVKKYPRISTIVFWHALRAKIRTNKYFQKTGHNDESDAFRHFIWSARLVKVIGPELTQEFLDAHENNPQQPTSEKAMDLANNRGGLLEAIKLKKIIS